MKSLLLFVISLLIAVTQLEARGEISFACSNPLFQNCENSFFCPVPFVGTPITKLNGTNICPDIADGDLTCCDRKSIAAVALAFETGRILVQTSINVFQQTKKGLDRILDVFQDEIDNVSHSHPELNTDRQRTIRNAYQSILNASRAYVTHAPSDWAQCAIGLLEYWAGLMCFGCNSHWSDYVDITGPGAFTLILDERTCFNMTGHCLPFFTDVSNYARSIAMAVAQIVSVTAKGENIKPLGGARDLCGGDCVHYICYDFIRGLQYKDPTAGFGESGSEDNEGSHHQTSSHHEGSHHQSSSHHESSHHQSSSHHETNHHQSSSHNDGNKNSRRATALESMRGAVEDLMNSKMNGLGSKFLRHFEDVESAVEEAHAVNARMMGSLYERRQGSSSGSNGIAFAPNGYPASQNGKSSGLNTAASVQSSSESGSRNGVGDGGGTADGGRGKSGAASIASWITWL